MHVTLVPASVAAPFVLPFLSVGIVQAAPSLAPVCVIRAFADRGRIDVHRVRIPSGLLTHWSSKRFAVSILARTEEVTPSRSFINVRLCIAWLPASRQGSVESDLFGRWCSRSPSKSLLKHLQGSFRTAFPTSVLKGGDAFVYIVAFHFEFHQVIV